MVIGAGKTGLDALLFLLDKNMDPDKICWIVSNDCWYFNRDMAEMENMYKSVSGQFDGILKSESVDEMYENYEKAGIFMRIDKAINPTKMRAATVSQQELENISLIKNIIRLGRIGRIEDSEILLEHLSLQLRKYSVAPSSTFNWFKLHSQPSVEPLLLQSK